MVIRICFYNQLNYFFQGNLRAFHIRVIYPKVFPRLVGFVLQHCASSIRRDTALSLCTTQCMKNAITSTSTRLCKLKTHTTYLENSIVQWQGILAKLQHNIHNALRNNRQNVDEKYEQDSTEWVHSDQTVENNENYRDDHVKKDSIPHRTNPNSDIAELQNDLDQFLTKMPYWSTEDLHSIVVSTRRASEHLTLLKSKQMRTRHQISTARHLYYVLIMTKYLHKHSMNRHHIDAIKKQNDQYKQQVQ